MKYNVSCREYKIEINNTILINSKRLSYESPTKKRKINNMLEISDTIIDVELIHYDLSTNVNLFTLLDMERVSVIFSVSITSKYFQDSMQFYQSFHNKYSSHIDIYIVYLSETQPFIDKRPIVNIPEGYIMIEPYISPIDKRRNMVESLLNDNNNSISILIDNLDNKFRKLYSPVTDRAFIILNGKIQYVESMFDTCHIDTIDNLSTILSNLIATLNIQERIIDDDWD